MAFKFALLFGLVAFASACSQAPGTTTTTVTTTVTTVSADEGDEGILSSHDRSVIRKTWDQAKKDGDVAPQVLYRFVTAHPEYQKMFSKFASVPQNELLGNGNFLAQAYTILAGLNVVVQSLSSQELLANQLNALGGAHQARGATPIMFEQFGEILTGVLAEELGSAFNAEAQSAWKSGLAALVAGISKTLKKSEDLADPQTKFTGRQIRDAQRTWENIRGGRNAMVSSIFIKLFKETPRVQKYFAKFANVAVDALAGNADYEKQVALVADRLDSMIAALDDKLQILGNMNYMRYTHAARSIPRGVWEDFGRLIFDVLSSKGLSADELNSWRGVLGVFLNGIAPKK
ncbi:hemoglobin [Daphnia pulex]|uniref:Hemoglobin n=1 Tax=Daphnia pulex TaxID=6669 RepID=E9FXJ7_DAPPU|nr:hemoglobin [Daphnia pulex]|eukprot:EFX88093.1 hemoglobin [Daphnia pulex]